MLRQFPLRRIVKDISEQATHLSNLMIGQAWRLLPGENSLYLIAQIVRAIILFTPLSGGRRYDFTRLFDMEQHIYE